MEIALHPLDLANRRPKPTDEKNLVFGRVFCDHMFMMDFTRDKGWQNPRIVPYHLLEMDPAAMVLHYGQGIFEGLKAYRWRNDKICLFRSDQNWERWNRSARRMCMPEIDPAFQAQAVEELLKLADTSAFLNPPASDVLRDPPPDLETQQRMVSLACGRLLRRRVQPG